LGGTIQVESSPGRGSRFRVEVPVYPAEAVETRAPDSSREQVLSLEPGQPDKRILIVEDQKENWVLLQRLLEEAGFQVRVAEDGLQAVEAFRVWRPHFIWMDLRLPGMDGMEAARRIRELDGGRDVKIVALTASAFASQREEVLAAGFDGFLRKPYRREEIFNYVAQQLGVRYVYSAAPKKTGGQLPFTLRPEDLASIPEPVREELEHAVISLNAERIMAAVGQVSAHDATLGNVLRRFAGKYQYTSILHALQRCKKSSTEASA
jgi:CheY-like chemotaxis protein